MLPSVRDLKRNGENCYSFVVAIAKKARAIAEKANDEGQMLDETPVTLAIEEYKEQKFIVKPPKEYAEADDSASAEIAPEKPDSAE